jgi:type 1 glutamine amidotransferase
MDIIGGRARFTKTIIPGEISTFWKHDEQMRVKIADRAHPITQGVDDFTIHDECYKGYYVRPDAHVLLTTDHPLSEPKLAWTYRYGNSPIVYLQLGHDHLAYENPAFRTLLGRSIRWVAGKL